VNLSAAGEVKFIYLPALKRLPQLITRLSQKHSDFSVNAVSTTTTDLLVQVARALPSNGSPLIVASVSHISANSDERYKRSKIAVGRDILLPHSVHLPFEHTPSNLALVQSVS
jgi:hypothetical protein